MGTRKECNLAQEDRSVAFLMGTSGEAKFGSAVVVRITHASSDSTGVEVVSDGPLKGIQRVVDPGWDGFLGGTSGTTHEAARRFGIKIDPVNNEAGQLENVIVSLANES